MILDSLYLEVTRQCNLRCEHCLRGENKDEYMSFETIKNAFKDVSKIKNLLLTGGEPLLALDQLEFIARTIKENEIEVDQITLIINGTVLNDRAVDILMEFAMNSRLRFMMSYDIFHHLELERLGLFEKRQSNFDYLDKLFDIKRYADFDESHTDYLSSFYRLGRARNLTDERLEEISRIANNNYVLSNFFPHYDLHYDGENITGTVNIDVNGNVVTGGYSFDMEDEEARNIASNINEIGLIEAVKNRIARYEIDKELYKEERNRLLNEDLEALFSKSKALRLKRLNEKNKKVANE